MEDERRIAEKVAEDEKRIAEKAAKDERIAEQAAKDKKIAKQAAKAKRREEEADAVIEEIKRFQPEWKRSGNGRLIKGGTISLTQVVTERVENNLVADASTPSQKKKLGNVVRKRASEMISSDSSPTILLMGAYTCSYIAELHSGRTVGAQWASILTK